MNSTVQPAETVLYFPPNDLDALFDVEPQHVMVWPAECLPEVARLIHRSDLDLLIDGAAVPVRSQHDAVWPTMLVRIHDPHKGPLLWQEQALIEGKVGRWRGLLFKP